MNLRDEEQLQQYFDRQMTSGEEQNFLINIAARDDMRLAFRSQLELLKVVRADKDIVPAAAMVRNRTLTALGLGAALLPNVLKDNETVQASLIPKTNMFWSMLKHPVSLLLAGVLAGTAITYSFVPSANNTAIAPQTAKQVAPQTLIVAEPPTTTQPTTNTALETKPVAKSSLHISSASKHTASTSQQTPTDIPVVKKSKKGGIIIDTKVNPPETSGH